MLQSCIMQDLEFGRRVQRKGGKESHQMMVKMF